MFIRDLIGPSFFFLHFKYAAMNVLINNSFVIVCFFFLSKDSKSEMAVSNINTNILRLLMHIPKLMSRKGMSQQYYLGYENTGLCGIKVLGLFLIFANLVKKWWLILTGFISY